MYCHNCGKQVNDDAKFCSYCGAALQGEASKSQPQDSGDLFGFDEKKAGQTQSVGGNTAQNGAQTPPQGGYDPYAYKRYTAPDDAKSVGFGILAFFFPMVGFILWLVWRDNYPLRARSCGKGVLAGIILYVIMVIIVVAVTCVAAQGALEYYYYY